MSRMQLALNVDDLDQAVAFYSKLFNTQPAKLKEGYANFAIAEPPLKLVLLQNPGKGGTINHLGVEVESSDTVHAEIARLKFHLARYRRAEFGRSSEKLERDIAQLELALETLESDRAEQLATASPAVATAVETAAEAQKPARRPLPEHLPREDLRHPAQCTCPSPTSPIRPCVPQFSPSK